LLDDVEPKARNLSYIAEILGIEVYNFLWLEATVKEQVG